MEDLIEEGEEENLSALDSTNLLDQDNGDMQKSGLLVKFSAVVAMASPGGVWMMKCLKVWKNC